MKYIGNMHSVSFADGVVGIAREYPLLSNDWVIFTMNGLWLTGVFDVIGVDEVE